MKNREFRKIFTTKSTKSTKEHEKYRFQVSVFNDQRREWAVGELVGVAGAELRIE
jgi:hypothetical protein